MSLHGNKVRSVHAKTSATAEEQCPVAVLHKCDELPEDNSNNNATSTSADSGPDNTVEAYASPESGGTCIDSFANYAPQFRERYTIQCLYTMTHVFSNPNVLDLLSCFGERGYRLY
ncbi:hypothetical protein BGZ98_007893 [Dissophora globulifera]|nr:hypothetical protein BGZ98_007893 [Dissophora globulifera]